MNISREQTSERLAIVRARLRPFVLFGLNEVDAPRHAADVLLYRQSDGSVDVEVPSSTWFGLRVVDLASGLENAAEAKHWLAEHEQLARRLVRQLDGRADVLRRVTEAALLYQRGFLDCGPSAHQARTRTSVAQEIGVHPSTVSRAVRGKSLRLPSGEVVDMSCLFGKGVAIRAALNRLITAGTNSRSDASLRDELSRQGVYVARRTVTKYRHELADEQQAGRH